MKGKQVDLWYSGKAHEHGGSVHDLTVAREHVLGALYWAASHNALLRGLRCLGERGFALLTGRWRTLHHITASPRKIGDIVKAALVPSHLEHGRLT